MLKVLIIGSNGQLGRSFKLQTDNAIALGIELQFTDRQTLDITNKDNIADFFKSNPVDIVVNTAAYTAVDLAEDNRELADDANHIAAKNLAIECQNNQCKLIHISTDYVFDGEQATAYVETDTTRPLGVYGETKLAGENAVLKHCPQAIVLRTSWVFSEFGNNFLKTMCRLGQTHRALNIVSDQYGKPTYAPHIANVALKIIALLEHQDVAGVYHFSGDDEVTWADFARYIFETSNKLDPNFNTPAITDITTDQYPTAAKRPKNSSLDCTKIYQLLGIEKYQWQQGVKLSIEALAKDSK